MNRTLRIWPLALLLSSCDPSGPRAEGWATTKQTGGPTVLWDALALPLPEIPLPNDAATRRDATSPTGRRLNISEEVQPGPHVAVGNIDGVRQHTAVNVSNSPILIYI